MVIFFLFKKDHSCDALHPLLSSIIHIVLIVNRSQARNRCLLWSINHRPRLGKARLGPQNTTWVCLFGSPFRDQHHQSLDANCHYRASEIKMVKEVATTHSSGLILCNTSVDQCMKWRNARQLVYPKTISELYQIDLQGNQKKPNTRAKNYTFDS